MPKLLAIERQGWQGISLNVDPAEAARTEARISYNYAAMQNQFGHDIYAELAELDNLAPTAQRESVFALGGLNRALPQPVVA